MGVLFSAATNQKLQRSSAPLLDAAGLYTLMCWVRVSEWGTGWRTILGVNDSEGYDAIQLYEVGGDSVFDLWASEGADNYSSTPYNINTWYHVAIVRNSDTDAKLYVNGVLDITCSTNVSGRSGTPAGFAFGNEYNVTNGFSGAQAFGKAWTTNLTQAEIQQEMYVARPVRRANLLGWWPFFPGSAERLIDYYQRADLSEVGVVADYDNPPVSWGSKIYTVPWQIPPTGGSISGGGLVHEWLEHASNPAQLDFTVAGWFYIRDPNEYPTLFAMDGGDNTCVQLIYEDGLWRLAIGGNSIWQGGTTYLSTSTWYHVAWVSNGANDNRVYLNGNLEINRTAETYTGESGIVFFSQDNTEAAYPGVAFRGNLANWKIWDGVQLTENEIKQEMYQYRPSRFADLWAWYPMMSDLQNALRDYSGNDRHLTSHGRFWVEDGPSISWGSLLSHLRNAVGAAPIEESITLAKSLQISSSDQTNIQDFASLGKSLQLNTLDELEILSPDRLSFWITDQIWLDVATPKIGTTGSLDNWVTDQIHYGVYTAAEGGPVEESVILDNHLGVLASGQTSENDAVTLDNHIAISESDQTTESDAVALDNYIGISELDQIIKSDAVALDNHIGISELDQTSENDAVALDNHIAISELDQTSESDAVALDNHIAISELDQTSESDATTLDRFAGLTVAEAIGGTATNESVNLEIYLSITKHLPGVVEEAVILDLVLTVLNSDQLDLQDAVSLNRMAGEDAVSDTNEQDAVSLIINQVIDTATQTNESDLVSLGRINIIAELDQTNESDAVSLGRINTIVPVSQTVENDATTLEDFIGISVLEEAQGFINETVILARSMAIEALEEGISHVSEDVSLSRLAGIDEISQCQVNDDLILNRLAGISGILQALIDESALLIYSIAIEALEEGISQVSEDVALSRLASISEIEQSQINEAVIFSHSIVIEALEEGISHVSEDVTLTRLSDISEATQCLLNDITLLNRLAVISEETQCQVNDLVSLSKFMYIIIIDETIGQYTEILTLGRIAAISIFQEGISHVAEDISLARSNLILINEESKIYNSLIFGRSNGISSSVQCQVSKSLIFARSNGLSIATQIVINENTTVSKFSIFNSSSQLMLNELLTLSRLDDFAILDSRYLLESVNLQYDNGLSLIDSSIIFEEIELGRIDIFTLITLLYGFNIINLNQSKSIIAEPPSLYVYNDGNHSIGVLFRDKRAEVLFRDKRGHILWRDKRGK